MTRSKPARGRAFSQRTDTDAAPDFGPAARCDVVREVVADPHSPNRTITRGRTRDGLGAMFVAGHLTAAQWIAAERFRDDLAVADGSRDRNPFEGSPAAFGPRAYADSQIDARGRVRASWGVIGHIGGGVVGHIVVGRLDGEHVVRMTCTEYEARYCLARGSAGATLRAALDRLDALHATWGK